MNTRTNHGAIVPIKRIKLPPFTLPTPPPGMKWHREERWTAEMLPPGTRPLCDGEAVLVGDEFLQFGEWKKDKNGDFGMVCFNHDHHRTTRPLLFTHEGHEWTWHRAGDPCPCAEKRIVQVLLNDGSPNRDPAMPEFWDWEGESPDEVKIIGWRYADAEKPDPYIQKEPAIAVHDVFPKAIPGAFGAEFREKLLTTKPDEIQWIEWPGGPCPLKDEEVAIWEVRYSDNDAAIFTMPPSVGAGWIGDNIYKAYRVLKWHGKTPKVPLGPEDVPPGSAVRVKGFNGFAQVLAVSETGVQLYSVFFTWESLATENREINRSIPMTGKWDPTAWEPCEK